MQHDLKADLEFYDPTVSFSPLLLCFHAYEGVECCAWGTRARDGLALTQSLL